MTAFDCLKNFAAENSRFRVSQKADGTININKTDGNWATISPAMVYRQQKGASWRSDIQAYLNEGGFTLA
jgi:hypothetical protein